MTTIAQQITEAEAWVRQHQTGAAKPGKGQSQAQHRLECATAALATLKWCQSNSELVRAVKAQATPPQTTESET